MIKQKIYLLFENFDQLRNLNIGLLFLLILVCSIFLVLIIVLLKPDFNCLKNFVLSWDDKVTTGTWRFVSVFENIVSRFVLLATILYAVDQSRPRLISQLIKSILQVLQKSLNILAVGQKAKYFCFRKCGWWEKPSTWRLHIYFLFFLFLFYFIYLFLFCFLFSI